MATKQSILAGAVTELGQSPEASLNDSKHMLAADAVYDDIVAEELEHFWSWASDDIPLEPVLDPDGNQLTSNIYPGRVVYKYPAGVHKVCNVFIRGTRSLLSFNRNAKGIHAPGPSNVVMAEVIRRIPESGWPQQFARMVTVAIALRICPRFNTDLLNILQVRYLDAKSAANVENYEERSPRKIFDSDIVSDAWGENTHQYYRSNTSDERDR